MIDSTRDNTWMLNDVVDVPGVRYVVVSTSDGLAKIRSTATERDEADRIAATIAGLQSLGRSTAQAYGSGSHAVRQMLFEFEGGWLLIRAAAEGSHLGVVTFADVDARLVSQQMQAVIRRLGEHTLATPARSTEVT
ncbi:roadblock/LC7 domain-containing protein [Nonomuraea sp. NPDC049400]|uniref:roadblock/LC7 domain-containing protein n=1 Tax=Nonomuraea sp. NPDC049400 TaxID=3364352 RepID=UPI003789067F